MLDLPQLPVSQRTNPERSYKEEGRSRRLGDGEVFSGEGILAVTKAIVQSSMSYVGGYQGAPVSRLVDVLVELQDLLDELDVHSETWTKEASAAAMVGASINYPMRGCVICRSIVGTNVAADALSNLASPGVIGGAQIVVGEDCGEGASVIQERTEQIRAAQALSVELVRELAETARLIKGYGDTCKAALADPGGDSLNPTLAAIAA